jgi:hypothetical protein
MAVDDLVRWLGEQLGADAAPIAMPAWHKGYCMESYVEDGRCLTCGADEDPDDVTYQERSPQALREVEAKRRVLTRMAGVLELGWDYYESDTVIDLARETLLDLASVYSDCPGYAEAITPAE